MAQLTLSSKAVLGSHAFLLSCLAEAIAWVRQRKKVLLQLPDEVSADLDGRPVSSKGCPPPTGGGRPVSRTRCKPVQAQMDERADAEVMLAVLKAMTRSRRRTSRARNVKR